VSALISRPLHMADIGTMAMVKDVVVNDATVPKIANVA
jgi:hypothetical protein